MDIHIKDIKFLVDVDPYCSSSELINARFFTDKNLLLDIENLKNSSLHFGKIEIIPEIVTQNLFNGQNPFEYFLKGNLPYYGHHLDQVESCEIPFEMKPNYIYVEDFSDLETLESLSTIYNATILSTKSFNRRSKNVFAYKSYLTLTQRLTLIKNAVIYVGYDYSTMAPIAKKLLMNNSIIYKTNQLKDEELMFRFINEDNIDFFKI